MKHYIIRYRKLIEGALWGTISGTMTHEGLKPFADRPLLVSRETTI